MTFKTWAKIFTICGWMNYSVAVLNVLAMCLAVLCHIPVPGLNIITFLVCVIIGWISFYLEDYCLELSDLFKEK
jgi:hypothetical protein